MEATYLSDRLFVALAKRAGFPTKQALRPVREEQLRLLEEGLSISLFSLARWEGALSCRQAEQLLSLGRHVAARQPAYRAELIEPEAERSPAEAEAGGAAEAFDPWVSDIERIAPLHGPEPQSAEDALELFAEEEILETQGLELVDQEPLQLDDDPLADLLEGLPTSAPAEVRSLATPGDPLLRDDWGDRREALSDSGVLLLDSGGDWVAGSAPAGESLPDAPTDMGPVEPEPFEVQATWSPDRAERDAPLDLADPLERAFESTDRAVPTPRRGAKAPERAERQARRQRRASRSRRRRAVTGSSTTYATL